MDCTSVIPSILTTFLTGKDTFHAELFDGAAGPIDRRLPLDGIDQPGEATTANAGVVRRR